MLKMSCTVSLHVCGELIYSFEKYFNVRVNVIYFIVSQHKLWYQRIEPFKFSKNNGAKGRSRHYGNHRTVAESYIMSHTVSLHVTRVRKRDRVAVYGRSPAVPFLRHLGNRRHTSYSRSYAVEKDAAYNMCIDISLSLYKS